MFWNSGQEALDRACDPHQIVEASSPRVLRDDRDRTMLASVLPCFATAGGLPTDEVLWRSARLLRG
jgi:hypothetical protein